MAHSSYVVLESIPVAPTSDDSVPFQSLRLRPNAILAQDTLAVAHLRRDGEIIRVELVIEGSPPRLEHVESAVLLIAERAFANTDTRALVVGLPQSKAHYAWSLVNLGFTFVDDEASARAGELVLSLTRQTFTRLSTGLGSAT